MKPLHEQELTARQERFILAYLTADSQEQAAKAAGIGHKTACAWMKKPAVQSGIMRARRRTFEKALQRLQAYAVEAATVLHQVMLDVDVPAGTRVRAAIGILEHAAGAHVIEQFSERIEQLEQALLEQQDEYRRSA